LFPCSTIAQAFAARAISKTPCFLALAAPMANYDVLSSVGSAICWIAEQIGHGKYFRVPSAQWSKYLKPLPKNQPIKCICF
jgi:hypothetical protein